MEDKKIYNVWIDELRININNLSQKEADELSEIFIINGYDMIMIENTESGEFKSF